MVESTARARASMREGLKLAGAAPRRFAEIFRHGDLVVEFYVPQGTDPQTPHTRDEVYIVAQGSGVFRRNGQREAFAAGDFLFVPAGMEHGFEDFSDDFATWVLFYGPEGGTR